MYLNATLVSVDPGIPVLASARDALAATAAETEHCLGGVGSPRNDRGSSRMDSRCGDHVLRLRDGLQR